MSHYLITGQNFSTLTDYIHQHGDTYTLLQDILKTKFPDKKFKNRIVADFSTKESILEAVKKAKKPFDGVIAAYENYILAASWISNYLQLPGLPEDTALACTDKYLMRSLFKNATEKISPDFANVDDESSLLAFARAHTYPLILKPANLVKSLLVTKNDSEEELLSNYRKSILLLQSTYKKYAPNRKPKLIIEEFLEGSVHSVDAFVTADGTPLVLDAIVDYQTGYDIGYDDNFHYSRILPSRLSNSDQAALRHCAEVGIRALGMKNSPAHVEIIMTTLGARIVEIGARNGGYRGRMHKLANDIDITGAALAISRGEQPNILQSKTDSVAVLELFPKHPGIFQGIDNQDRLESLPSLNYLSIKATKSQFIGKAADGYKMSAVIILHNDDKDNFNNDLSFINSNVHVITSSNE